MLFNRNFLKGFKLEIFLKFFLETLLKLLIGNPLAEFYRKTS